MKESEPQTNQHELSIENAESILKHFSKEDIDRFNAEYPEYLKKLTQINPYRDYLLDVVLHPDQENPYEIGYQTVENTQSSSKQLLAALFLSGKFEMDEKNFIIHEREWEGKKLEEHILNFKDAADKHILSGFKILDLGCGQRPFFSYLCRKLGATVYTVDVIPASSFEGLEYGAKPDEDAAKYHIQLDLSDADAVQKLIESSGGDFNFVTEAHLSSDTVRTVGGKIQDVSYSLGSVVADKVLISEGLYFNGFWNKVFPADKTSQ